MATATAQVKVVVTKAMRDSFYKSDARVNEAIASKWIQNAVDMREPLRKAIDASNAKAVAQVVVDDLLANATTEAEKAAAMKFISTEGSTKGQVKTLPSYWSEINQAEKNTGVQVKIDRGGRSISFAADGRTFVIKTRHEVQALNKMLSDKINQVDHAYKSWRMVENNGTVTLESSVIPKPVAPVPAPGSQTAPVQSAEQEAKELLNSLPAQVLKAVRGSDSKPRTLTEKEQQQVAGMAKNLILTLAAQEDSKEGKLSNSSLNSLVALIKGLSAIPQAKAVIAK